MLKRLRSGLMPGLVVALISGLTACGDDEGGPADPDDGTPTQLAFITEASDVAAGGAITPAPQVAIRDASGDLVTSATNAVTVELASNPGGATLMGTTTVNAVDGVATLSDLSLDVVGSGFTLRASSGNLQSATTPSFDVSPGAPAALVFLVEPSDAEVNLAMAPAVEVGIEDEFGNAVTTATNAVTLDIATNPGGGTLGGMTTVDAVGGVASFTDLAVTKTGTGYTLAATATGLTAPTSAEFDVAFPLLVVASGESHSCAITLGGNTYCWGQNNGGQLGDGTTTSQSIPVLVQGGRSFTAVAGGSSYSCGLEASGDVYCWGRNFFGNLGDGTTTDQLTPVQVSGGLSFTSLTVGGGHACGLVAGGDAYCWGLNNQAQLGDGGFTNQPTPVQVSGGLSFSSISAGRAQTCGITSGGETYCWGGNSTGQLGDGTNQFKSAPTLVSGGLSFRSVAASVDQTCAVTTDDDAYCWGYNFDGQLGDGTNTDSNVPVSVMGGLSFAEIPTALSEHTCGLIDTGEAYCWGYNLEGGLGDGTNTSRNTPVAVSGGLSFSSIAVGRFFSCGLSTDGDAYCWGFNQAGQLGDGTNTDSNTPVLVSDP